jgi:ABC-type multidrug transport system ATPase subunit
VSAAVELIKTTKYYGRVRALNQLTLEIPEGSLFGLIGPNGAGKTTTFSLLCGFLRPTSGEIKVRGATLTPGTPPVGKILALPQDATLPGRTKVLDTMVLLSRLTGRSKTDSLSRGQRALDRVGLGDLADRRVDNLSHGQRRRVGIAQTLLGDDEVIILDEPTSGLDPRTAAELRDVIRELHKERTIILSTHNLAEIEALCTHAAILDKGELVTAGTMDQIRQTGARLVVSLAKPLDSIADIVSVLAVTAGVASARAAPSKDMFEIEVGDEKNVDEITNQALRLVLERGGAVKGVERGKSLEQRFMETTTGR